MKKILLTAISAFFLSFLSFPQNTTNSAGMQVLPDRIRTGNEGFASEEFRRGVQSYNKGAFSEAIVQFEKALSYLPNDNLILDWLGKAYYKIGLEGEALNYWQNAVNNGYGGLLLQNKVEIVRERRVTGEIEPDLLRLSESGSFPGVFNGQLVYNGPVSVQPEYNGTMWIAAYNSNEILMLNQNGKVVDRYTGPLNGFDRPFDIIRLKNGKLLVSENAGDRLSLLNEKGRFEKYIGSKGIGLGQMVGPLYLAQDDLERIYVTDYGNKRVDVFDKDGNPLFFFGKKSEQFAGLKGPTGIAVLDDVIFVADDYDGVIYEFDMAGNFIRELCQKKSFKKPEGIKVWNEKLLVCDQNRIIGVDTQTGALFEYAKTGNAPSRLTVANPDVNGNVIVSDFTANEIYVMSQIQELVGGLFVQIEQIDSSAFPNVVLEVKIENRHRQPLVGLQEENFYFSENKRPVSNLKFSGAASNNTEADITIVIDRSNLTDFYKKEVETAVKEISSNMHGGVLRIVSAGSIPVSEYVGKPGLLGDFSLDALKNPVSKKVSIDLALRLAANDLINAAKKRGIVLITCGNQNAFTFDRYNLGELSSYLNNNSISFSVINVSQNAVCSEISYISENTQGNEYYIYRPQGLSDVVKDIINIPQGVYQFSFTSSLPTNFGMNYLPLEVEVYLLNRSGRDETGYFAPLE